MKNREILNSWKEISDYLDRDIRTCLRWEKELGLPVHRIDATSFRSKVFAYKSEIDNWLKEKAKNNEIKKKSILGNRWVNSIILSSLILFLAIFVFLYFSQLKKPAHAAKSSSIAVFPFENLNSSEYHEYFSEGIPNEITKILTMHNNLKVIPSSVTFNNKNRNEEQMAKELDVDYILKGKIKKTDRKILLEIQLIRTKDYKSLWRAEYDEELENIFSIQENVCRKISETLNIDPTQILNLPLNNIKAKDYLAFDTYLKGNYILNRLNGENKDLWKLYHQGNYYSGKLTRNTNELAIKFFNEAIQIDNNFAQAYYGLANCYINYLNMNWDFDATWLDKAENLIQKAQMLSPDLPEFYYTSAKIDLIREVGFNENTKQFAFELAQEGIKKYPNHPQLNAIYGYCHFLKYGEEGSQADLDNALRYMENNFWLNPYSLNNIIYAEILMLNHEFSKAIEICNMIEKHDYSLMAKFKLGEIYYYLGDLEQSRTIFQEFEDASLDFKIDSLFYLGMIASQLGEIEKTLKIAEEIKLICPKELIKDDYLKLASIYLGMDRKETAYNYLKSFFYKPGIKKMRFNYYKYIEMDKNFDNYRKEDEFQKIITS